MISQVRSWALLVAGVWLIGIASWPAARGDGGAASDAVAARGASGDAAAGGQSDGARALEIYFIDVLGGAATLLVTPHGESVLIDSGWAGHDDRDPNRIVHVLKDLAGCNQIDHLVTTHWHRDHFGGVAGLSQKVSIAHFWDRGLPEDHDPALDFPDGPKDDDPLLVAYRAASKAKRTALRPGDTLPLTGLKALVLASGGRVIDRTAAVHLRENFQVAPNNPLCSADPVDPAKDPSDNARSLALLFSLGSFQFFDAGDLTSEVEKKLVCPLDLIGAVDLYQVTHHGMDVSNYPILVRTLAPKVAIMNNGPRKGGSPAVVKLLKKIPSLKAAYQLHRNSATSDDDNTEASLIANKEEAGGEFIHVHVEPDGSKFTVQIGEHGAKKTFE
jgi:beta-lactamase superfamily II metal-dependent hydrolase